MNKKWLLTLVFCVVALGWQGSRATAQSPVFGGFPGAQGVYRPGFVPVPNYSLYNAPFRGCNRGFVYPSYSTYYWGYPGFRTSYYGTVTSGYGMGGFPPYGAYGLGGSGVSIWFGR